MHKYETLFILHPELGEVAAKELLDRTRKLIEGMNGVIDDLQEWGMRELAYPIHKLNRGYYILLQFTSHPDVVKELERTFKISDDVLRYVSVRRAAPRKTAAVAKTGDEVAAAVSGEIEQAAQQGD